MIAFGSVVTEDDAYRRYTEPGIARAAEPDSAVLAFAGVGSIARSYNILLDAAARCDDLEAFVLVHPHTEIAAPDLCRTVRGILRADPRASVIGSAGGRGVRGAAWWEGTVSAADTSCATTSTAAASSRVLDVAPHGAVGEVDVVDGSLMVLSPWAVRSVRFDERLRLAYGHDVDFCRQVRAAGRTVVTADIPLVLHHALDMVEDLELWVEAAIALAEKWEGDEPDDAAWKARARRAEAEREVTRAIAHGNALAADARVLAAQRALGRATGTRSWRLTAPLRRVNGARAEARARLRARRG